ncbi:hypothetical protein [Actinoplanes sp. NPDC023714]|uniref:hypothetical protein n=1 Tax=Actinoplanes sp. NPDC023714 TaxID=3154322 RepID=UPI0033EF1AED
MTAPPARPLTAPEQAILSAFLSLPIPGLPGDLPGLRVTGRCGCGCPTIHFNDSTDDIALVADAPPPPRHHRPPSPA